MNKETHASLLRKVHGLAARGVRHDLPVIRRAADFVGASDVGRTHASDRHAVVLDVLASLELVEDLVHGVLALAVWRLVLVREPVPGGALLGPHPPRGSADPPPLARQPPGLSARFPPPHLRGRDLLVA